MTTVSDMLVQLRAEDLKARCEAADELGDLHAPEAVDGLLGALDDYVSRSGFVISPLVFWGGRADALVPDPSEVASVHRIPLTELLREDLLQLEPPETEGRPILRIRIGQSWMAAPTAALLYQFREVCIAGNATRVSHFDQPLFARS